MYVWVFISNVADAQCVLKNNSLQLMGGRMCTAVLLSQRMYVHLFLRQVAQIHLIVKSREWHSAQITGEYSR